MKICRKCGYKGEEKKFSRGLTCKTCENSRIAAWKKTSSGKAKSLSIRERHRSTAAAKWKRYLDTANKKGRVFELTQKEFEERFFHKPCEYCGDDATGIDRVDNDGGYTTYNTVPCCSTCNYMKLTFSREDFVKKCGEIAAGG